MCETGINETLDRTRATGKQTLREIIAHAEDEALRHWWSQLAELDAELAERAGALVERTEDVMVVTDGQYFELAGRFERCRVAADMGWVWFRSAPTPDDLGFAIVGGIFGIASPVDGVLHQLLMKAVAEQDANLLRLMQRAAITARQGTVAEIEGKLGAPLAILHQWACSPPGWASLEYDPAFPDGSRSEWVIHKPDLYEEEPMWFVWKCVVDGILLRESGWDYYAQCLFGEEQESPLE